MGANINNPMEIVSLSSCLETTYTDLKDAKFRHNLCEKRSERSGSSALLCENMSLWNAACPFIAPDIKVHLESENLHQCGQLLRRVRVPEVYPPAGAAEGRRGQQRSVGGEVTGGQEVQGLPGSSRQVPDERIRAQAPQANHLREHRSVTALMSIILRKLFSVTASGTGWSMQLTVKKRKTKSSESAVTQPMVAVEKKREQTPQRSVSVLGKRP